MSINITKIIYKGINQYNLTKLLFFFLKNWLLFFLPKKRTPSFPPKKWIWQSFIFVVSRKVGQSEVDSNLENCRFDQQGSANVEFTWKGTPNILKCLKWTKWISEYNLDIKKWQTNIYIYSDIELNINKYSRKNHRDLSHSHS
jgi:hypothetical protein